jgi:hypothetical protein
MKVNIQELLQNAGLEDEAFYPGKKLVKKYIQHGEYKSHCAVFDWHDGKNLRVEIKAGMFGHTLDAKELRHYPVSFQAATYLDIKTVNDNIDDSEEDEDGKSASGKSGGGGKKPAVNKENIETEVSLSAFSRMADGAVSLSGEIQKFVIMGREIAKEAYAQALDNLKTQLSQTKIMAMDLMKGVSDIIQKATPGGGLEARGNETIKYKYDAEKTGPMFGGITP